MKQFYNATLLIGFLMAVVMQFVTIGMPPDALVAHTLSETPDQWSIEMDERMASRLSRYYAIKKLSQKARFCR